VAGITAGTIAIAASATISARTRLRLLAQGFWFRMSTTACMACPFLLRDPPGHDGPGSQAPAGIRSKVEK
jgi:hypothetical protein